VTLPRGQQRSGSHTVAGRGGAAARPRRRSREPPARVRGQDHQAQPVL